MDELTDLKRDDDLSTGPLPTIWPIYTGTCRGKSTPLNNSRDDRDIWERFEQI